MTFFVLPVGQADTFFYLNKWRKLPRCCEGPQRARCRRSLSRGRTSAVLDSSRKCVPVVASAQRTTQTFPRSAPIDTNGPCRSFEPSTASGCIEPKWLMLRDV